MGTDHPIHGIEGGLIVAACADEVDDDSMDVGALFEMHARAMYGAAMRLIAEKKKR